MTPLVSFLIGLAIGLALLGIVFLAEDMADGR